MDEIEHLIEKRNDKRIILRNNLSDKLIRNTLCKLGWHLGYELLFNYLSESRWKCIYCGKYLIKYTYKEADKELLKRDYY